MMRDSFPFSILWWCCFLFLVFRCGGTNRHDLGCFQYVLENECTAVVGNVSIEEKEQQHFFNEFVSLIVSDVRMEVKRCRRPFLSFYCQLMFGKFSCESSSLEEQRCLEEQYCLQVADACSGHFEVNCSSLLPSSPTIFSVVSTNTPSPSYNCTEEVTEQIEEVEKKPIQVQTCLNSSKEDIRCCFDPFVFDDNDECVVGCPQYFFGEQLENTVRNIALSIIGMTFILFGLTIIPLYLLTDLRYPNHVLYVTYAFYLLTFYLNFLVIFYDTNHYICQGEKNYWEALWKFGHSKSRLIQFVIWIFLVHLSFSIFALFSFNLFCLSMRPHTSFFEKFIRQPVSPFIILLLEGTAVLLSFAVGIGIFLDGLFNDSVFLVPVPIYGLPYPIDHDLVTSIRVLILFWGGSSTIFVLLSLFFFIKRGVYIVYYQWRALITSLVWSVLFLFFSTTLFIEKPSFIPLLDYVGCVASHPQSDPPPCKREYDDGTLGITFALVTAGTFFFLFGVPLCTNPVVVQWWKELIFSRRLITKPEQLNPPENAYQEL